MKLSAIGYNNHLPTSIPIFVPFSPLSSSCPDEPNNKLPWIQASLRFLKMSY
jgi:hypothetical protein